MPEEVETSGAEPRGRVLLTGATGFLGRGLVGGLSLTGYRIRAATRDTTTLPKEVESAVVGDLRRPINLSEALRDVDYVVHSAGLTHSVAGLSEDTYREVNAGITQTLASAAHKACVGKFVLLSSVRAQIGPESAEVVAEAEAPRPLDAYGRSKLEAERLLAEADVSFVVLCLALTHGAGMRFNMSELLRLVRSRWPLPFGAFRAKRSILARDHLIDAVALALASQDMSGQIYLAADPDPLSVGEMVAAFRAGWSRSPGLILVPPGVVDLVARPFRRHDQIHRLRQRLVVDPSKLMAAGWVPRRSAFEALAETARAS